MSNKLQERLNDLAREEYFRPKPSENVMLIHAAGSLWEVRRETSTAKYINGHGEVEMSADRHVWRLYRDGARAGHWWTQQEALAFIALLASLQESAS